jgi:hypothetical protein
MKGTARWTCPQCGEPKTLVEGPATVSRRDASVEVPKWRRVHVCPCWAVERGERG